MYKKEKQFRWALWWGLGIVLITIGLLSIPGIDDGNDPVGDLLLDLLSSSFIILILAIGIIIPILEEICFRLWGNGKKWTGIVSSILMAIVIMGVINWYTGLICLGVGLVITLAIKDTKPRLLAMMFFSSVLFMIGHKSNYSGDLFPTILGMVEKFGFGLLASYLVINHNILWSMALHILNNTISCIILYFSIANIAPTTFTIQDRCDVTIRPMILDKDAQSNYYMIATEDTVSDVEKLENIVRSMLDTELAAHGNDVTNDTIVVNADSRLSVVCSLQIVYAPGVEHDTKPIVNELQKMGWIELDTVPQLAYTIKIIDSTRRIDPATANSTTWVGEKSLRRYGLPVIELEGFNYAEWPVFLQGKISDVDAANKQLEPYGLTLEMTNKRVEVIKITSLYDPLVGK